eukprot:scaffold103165_cov61-Phaeocystis_antarctica.AAC.1
MARFPSQLGRTRSGVVSFSRSAREGDLCRVRAVRRDASAEGLGAVASCGARGPAPVGGDGDRFGRALHVLGRLGRRGHPLPDDGQRRRGGSGGRRHGGRGALRLRLEGVGAALAEPRRAAAMRAGAHAPIDRHDGRYVDALQVGRGGAVGGLHGCRRVVGARRRRRGVGRLIRRRLLCLRATFAQVLRAGSVRADRAAPVVVDARLQADALLGGHIGVGAPLPGAVDVKLRRVVLIIAHVKLRRSSDGGGRGGRVPRHDPIVHAVGDNGRLRLPPIRADDVAVGICGDAACTILPRLLAGSSLRLLPGLGGLVLRGIVLHGFALHGVGLRGHIRCAHPLLHSIGPLNVSADVGVPLHR